MSNGRDNIAGYSLTVGTADVVITDTVAQYDPIIGNLPDGAVRPYKFQFLDSSVSGQYETGVGSWNAGSSTWLRTTVKTSSNGGAKENFGAGPKVLFIVSDYESLTDMDNMVESATKKILTVDERQAILQFAVFDTVADMLAYTGATIGQSVRVLNYSATCQSGVLFFEAVALGTGTADGGSYIDGVGVQWKQQFPANVFVESFGVVGDGVTDDYAKIMAAVAVAKASRIKDIYFSAKVYGVSDTIDLVDAPGVKLIGQGGGFFYDGVNRPATTTLKRIGALTTQMVRTRSTQSALVKMHSPSLIGIEIDCNSLATHGLHMTSVNNAYVDDVTIMRATEYGLLMDCLDNKLASGAGGAADNQNNYFNRLAVQQTIGDCIHLGGNLGTAATVAANTSLNVFGEVQCNIRNNNGMVFGYSDGNQVQYLRVYKPSTGGYTGVGLVFAHDNDGDGKHARDNTVLVTQTSYSGVLASAGDGTQPSIDNTIVNFITGNGGVAKLPVIEAGASLSYATHNGMRGTGGVGFIAAAGATATAAEGTLAAQRLLVTNESLRAYNNSARHSIYSTAQGDMYGVNVGTSADADFSITRLSGAGRVAINTPLRLSGQTTATSATAGAASALPATPQAYLVIAIGGVDRKIPFYV